MKAIIILVVFIFLSAGGYYVYQKYEVSKHEEINALANISIFAINEKDNYVRTGYNIYIDGIISESGETSSGGAILKKVPSQSNVTITNRNIDDQSFYFFNLTKENISMSEISRFNLKLSEPSEVDYLIYGDVGIENNITLELTSKNFQDLGFCVYRSLEFLWVKTNTSFDEIERFGRFADYDKCYLTNFSLNESNKLKVPIIFKKWKELDESAHIDIIFFDGDNGNYSDNWGKDTNITLRTEWTIINNI